MKIVRLTNSLRSWSLALGATSIFPIAFFAYQSWQFSRWAKTQVGDAALICGTGMFALLAVCVAIAGVLSAAAVVVGFMSYSRVEKPRPRKRLIEIVLVGTMMFIACIAGFALV